MEMKVPEHLYGSTLLVPMTLDREHDGTFGFCIEIIRTYLLMGVTVAIQTIFLHQVYLVNQQTESVHNKCTDTDYLLLCVCVFTFEAAVWAMIRDAVSFCWLLIRAPVRDLSDSRRTLVQYATGAQVSNGRARNGGAILDSNAPRKRNLVHRLIRGSGSVGHEPWTLEGITKRYKIWSFITLALPQLALTSFLSFVGGDFIANSDNKGDLIMNTVGVLFINEVGDILYQAFTSDVLKEDMAKAKGVEVEVSNKLRWSLWLTSVFYPLSIAVYSFGIVFLLPMLKCSDTPLIFI